MKLGRVFGFAGIALVLVVILAFVYFLIKFPAVGPPSNLKVEATPEMVKRGEYLANHVAVCIDCHSTRNWEKYSGPIIAGTEGMGGAKYGHEEGLPGTFFVENITPAGIGQWSDGEVARLVTSGVDREGKPIFPFMPYPSYNTMDEEDLHSIIAYVRSLKPIENKIPESSIDFPLNLIVKLIPKPYAPEKRPNPQDTVAYGKYLVNMADCAGCHTPMEKGRFIDSLRFSGGMEFIFPTFVAHSANITPDKETGIGEWEKDDFLTHFRDYATDAGRNIAVGKDGFNTPMPWTMYAGMTDEDLNAIYTYLRTVKPIKHKVEKFTGKDLTQ